MMQQLDHLLVVDYKQRRNFKSNLSVRRDSPPQRERQAHGHTLLAQLSKLRSEEIGTAKRRADLGLPSDGGMVIAIEISPPGSIDYSKQLEWKRDGIEVVSAVNAGGTEIVALYVPEGKLSAFETRVRAYLEVDVKSKKKDGETKPKNARLINAIDAFRKAAFNELWTDEDISPPDGEAATWVQIWLRSGGLDSKTVRDRFLQQANRLGIEVEEGWVSFPGRTVVAARSTRSSFESALELLDMVAEIRGVAPTAEFYLSDLKPHEQAKWIQNLQERTTHSAPGECPYVTLLDTGVNGGHPLLTAHLSEDDMHAVSTNWGVTDHDGHGTGMAGLVLHGDLTGPLSSDQANVIPHRLESVKILPPDGQNASHLYGWVSAQATKKVEEEHTQRRRTFAMMTTSIGNSAGLPTEWSASIDAMAFGLGGVERYQADILFPDPSTQPLRPRLFVLSAGNVHWSHWENYPSGNDTSTIENPAQAWNAISVGACTNRTTIDHGKWPSLKAISEAGALSPSSTTSLLWKRTWPFKPDVVAEGGNGSIDSTKVPKVTVGPESLRILTTSHEVATSPLAETGDTSAAAAEVARICGILQSKYPRYWPETIRALVIHGARYTPAMRSQLPLVPSKQHKETLLRRFGYGRVELEVSMNSVRSRPTLILQEQITPYANTDGSTKLNELNMHDLPWPKEQLQEIASETVAMRVTLSYFVEPNPSQRGWQSKFRYQSHGLRFAVKGATETDERFGQRINKLEREELEPEELESMDDPDRGNWFLGSQLRSRGSIHSDVWIGSAAQLASKSHVAVFPVGGWWKDWKDSQRHDKSVRYAIVISLEVLSEADVDLYTPIAIQIGVPVPTEIDVGVE